MNYSIGIEKIKQVAEELGIELVHDPDRAGRVMMDNGDCYEFRDFFSEAFAILEEDEPDYQLKKEIKNSVPELTIINTGKKRLHLNSVKNSEKIKTAS